MSMQRERIRTKTAEVWRNAQYASVGIELGISIALGYWVGGKAQAYWDIAPWGVIVGVLLGFASGLRRLMKIAIAESKRAAYLPTNPEPETALETAPEVAHSSYSNQHPTTQDHTTQDYTTQDSE